MDSVELSEWQIFDSIDPIGAWRDDYSNGLLCALHANMNRKKGAKPYTPQDFMPFLQQEEIDKQQAMEDAFLAFAVGHNQKLEKVPPLKLSE